MKHLIEMEPNKFLEKIPVDKIYEDLLQPGLEKTGEALSTVLDIANLILRSGSFASMEDTLDLYTDYLLSSFGQTSATGLSRLVDGQLSHDSVTRLWPMLN